MKTIKLFLKILFFAVFLNQTTQAQETAKGNEDFILKDGRARSSLEKKHNWINKKNGTIKYFEYDEDFVVDDLKMCNELEVKNFVIKKGRYFVDYSDEFKGGKLIWILKTPIKSSQKSNSIKTFRTAGGKAKHCSIASNCCLSTADLSETKTVLQSFTFTPISLNGLINSIELQFIDIKTPTAANH